MEKFMREFIGDIWATQEALAAWRRGDTDWPLSLKQFLAYLLMSGVAFIGGVSAGYFFFPGR